MKIIEKGIDKTEIICDNGINKKLHSMIYTQTNTHKQRGLYNERTTDNKRNSLTATQPITEELYNRFIAYETQSRKPSKHSTLRIKTIFSLFAYLMFGWEMEQPSLPSKRIYYSFYKN